MRQSRADTLVTEEPDALIAHVRVCGGAGWVTTGSTRKLLALGTMLAHLREEGQTEAHKPVVQTSIHAGDVELF